MNYIECQFKLEPYRPFNEILVAQLSDLEFESFVEEEENQTLKGYIIASSFEETEVKQAIGVFSDQVEINFSFQTIERVNWNKKWEENFDAISIGKFCHIRAPFHEEHSDFKHEIIIEPKMSFGTGHHQTTQMMIELMEQLSFQGTSVLDMGSGTGVLAILAKKMGAEKVDAIDIEDWAYENMKENFLRNNVEVMAGLGDAELLGDDTYEVILANINKNILLNDFKKYDQVLQDRGFLLLSGFYQSDEEDILSASSLKNYEKLAVKNKDRWCAILLQKSVN